MPIGDIIARTPQPGTLQSLCADFHALGLRRGHTVLVHSSLSQLGYIVGGPSTVIAALLDALGDTGTLMMPTHTTNNTNPGNWRHPPVPELWRSVIRATTPAFDPQRTPSNRMGVLAELFRTYPGVKRSLHPVGSFAAIGKHADFLLRDHVSLSEMFGAESPVGRLYELNAYVLLLGVGHLNNTSLHLAEYRADYPNKRYIQEGTALQRDGKRVWAEYEMLALNNDDFEQIGAAYAETMPDTADFNSGRVGIAQSRFLRQRPLVDFAAKWMTEHRA